MANRNALVLVDYQNDFAHAKGALRVTEGDAILQAVNALMAQTKAQAGLVVATQDWHPADHVSFAATHGFPNEATKVGGAMYWPAHCVANDWGADFLEGLDLGKIDRRVLKAFEKNVDSYSGFGGREFKDGKPGATLEQVLREQGVDTVDVAGLATEYCDKATVLDALKLGFKVRVHRACIRAVNPADGEKALAEMAAAGAVIV